MSRLPKITPDERRLLRILVGAPVDFDSFSFRPLMKRLRLSRGEVRRLCRSLCRKGLAEFNSGLWFEDGGPAGSGYSASALARENAPSLTVCK